MQGGGSSAWRLPIAVLGVALVGVVHGACGGAQGFVCTDDAQCAVGDRLGACESNGFCSFPDDACPSGSRYGEHAGAGLAGECVDDGGTTGDATSPTTTAATSDPITSTEEPTTDRPMPVCGDMIVEDGEDCELAVDLDLDCQSLGYDGGELQCSSTCTFDPSACTMCGNGVIEGAEECDAPSLGDVTCMGLGFVGGEIACTDACDLDVSGCNSCGDGVLDPGELCEGFVPMALSCFEVGLGGGSLDCVDCDLSIDACENPVCGVDPEDSIGECPPECDECDNDTCIFACLGSSECARETIVCPSGWDCHVLCDGPSACSDATVTCSELFGCQVSCSGSSACSDIEIDCGGYGQCELECQDGPSVCNGAVMHCGFDACTATCGPNVLAIPDVQCFGQCACSTCAGG